MSARLLLVLACGLACGPLPLRAADFTPLLDSNDEVHLDRALEALNMTPADLGFTKDVAEPLWALGWIRRTLEDPLRLPATGDRIVAAAETNVSATIWPLAAELLECSLAAPHSNPSSSGSAPAPSGGEGWGEGSAKSLDPTLVKALSEFVAEAAAVTSHLSRALGALDADQRQYAAAETLAGVVNAEDHPERGPLLAAAGMPSQVVARVVAEGSDLDPRPAATNYLEILSVTRFDELLAAGRDWHGAVERLADTAAAVTRWPSNVVRLESPLGPVVVGTPGADLYREAALLILDPGGDDVYAGEAGAANGLLGWPLAAIVDLGGNDTYAGDGVLGPGSAVFGSVCLLDCAGDDLYRMAYAGEAAAVFGTAWLDDAAGDDVYRAGVNAQAAAVAGVAVLRDRAGNDLYDIGLAGQAYAGVRGFALLLDEHGQDHYTAGGREPDYERFPDRFVSLAQGMAIGARPFFGGGVAALVDLEGNDSYVADVYGQGAGSWYSAGFLLDRAGHDSYRLYQYGQGAGIHLGLGLLADGGGDDAYSGFGLVQGDAHDYAVGMLLDHAGNDTYTAESGSQGRGINNALGLLVDRSGDDGYFGRLPDECQGIGHNGGLRDYGCLSILLDLGGHDRYTCGATDGARLIRPLYGIVYDVENHKTP